MFARLLLRSRNTSSSLAAARFVAGNGGRSASSSSSSSSSSLLGTNYYYCGGTPRSCGSLATFSSSSSSSSFATRERENEERTERRGVGVGVAGGRFPVRRAFSADAGSSSDAGNGGGVTTTSTSESERLSAILRAEIKHEAESYEASETATGGPPDGWTLSEKEGDCDVYLSKEFGEDEEILVHFSASDDPMETEYGRDDNGVDDVIDEGLGDEDIEEEFSVTVMKNGKQLEFFCVTDGELIEIQHVQYEGFEWNEGGGGEGSAEDSTEGEEDVLFDEEFDDNNYPGPHFEDLDKGVQDAFLSYLEERGINAELADYIIEKRIDKEQREYTSWLQKVADFLK